MAEVETWAIVAFTGILVLIEIHRVVGAYQETRLERVQRKIELAFTISARSWTEVAHGVGGKDEILRAARTFQELTAVLDFPEDNVLDGDVRNVLNGLLDLLRGTKGVDRTKEFEQVQERIRWGVMGWVEESERLQRAWWLT